MGSVSRDALHPAGGDLLHGYGSQTQGRCEYGVSSEHGQGYAVPPVPFVCKPDRGRQDIRDRQLPAPELLHRVHPRRRGAWKPISLSVRCHGDTETAATHRVR